MVAARSIRKSFGRFWRSVEMITQRPVTGSLRNSGIERVLKNLDGRPPRVEMDRDDVEPARDVGEMVSHDVVDGEPHNPPALARSHRLGRLAERSVVARLDLDEHQRRSIAGDDVQFATAPPMPPGNYCVPAAFQLPAGEIFARFPQGDATVRHAGAVQQIVGQITAYHEAPKEHEEHEDSTYLHC